MTSEIFRANVRRVACAGALVTPLIAAVITLIYYRLAAAGGEQAEPGQNPGGFGQ